MLENFHVQNFRALKDVTIEKTARINLIVGGNNVGKTSLLEAMYVLLGSTQEAQNIHSAFRFDASSGWHKKTDNTPFEASGNMGEGKRSLKVPPSGTMVYGGKYEPCALAINMAPFKTSELIDQFGAVAKRKRKDRLVSLLKLIDFSTKSIEVLPTQGKNWGIFIENDAPDMIEIPYMGQGFTRVFGMYCRLIASDRKIALIDEVEIGMHRDSLPFLWGALKDASEVNDMQIFATTHSYECIQAAAATFKDTPELFQLIRLVKTDEGIKALCFSGEEVEAAIEYGAEVR